MRKNEQGIYFVTTTIFIAAVMISGCVKKPFEDFGKTKELYKTEVHTSDDTVKKNEEFTSKIRYGDGTGDFEITPLKYGESPSDFSLILKNNNSFNAGAYLTFIFRDESGKTISSGENKSRVLAPGAADLVLAAFGDGDISDFDSLTITAYVRDAEGEGVYENVDTEKIREVGNARTGAGRRIDLAFSEEHEAYTHDFAVFYDSDGNVYKVQSFIGSDNTAWIYTDFDYASYDIIAWKTIEEAGKLPEEVLAEYRSKGLLTEREKEYESLDGRIGFSFKDTKDGHTLICCRNNTEDALAMRKDTVVFFGENTLPADNNWEAYRWDAESGQEYKLWTGTEEDGVNVYKLMIAPGEELYWDIGISAKEDFYMLPFAAERTEMAEPVPELSISESGSGATVSVTQDASYEYNVLKGIVTLMALKDGEIVAEEMQDFEDAGEHQVDLNFNIDADYDELKPYIQYRYVEIPMPGV